MDQKPCAICGSVIERGPGTSAKRFEERTKYCSRTCNGEANRRLKKGRPRPRHKEGCSCVSCDPETTRRWIETRKPPSGEGHYLWKGDDVGYTALHDWMKKVLPKPKACMWCDRESPLDLANLGTYDRDPSNWAYLCKPCHKNFDNSRRPLVEVECANCGEAFLTAWPTLAQFCRGSCKTYAQTYGAGVRIPKRRKFRTLGVDDDGFAGDRGHPV